MTRRNGDTEDERAMPVRPAIRPAAGQSDAATRKPTIDVRACDYGAALSKSREARHRHGLSVSPFIRGGPFPPSPPITWEFGQSRTGWLHRGHT